MPIVDVLAPGLSQAQVATALATRGLAASPEVVAWFGWHNGLTRRPVVAGEEWCFRGVMTLEECLADFDWHVATFAEVDMRWEPEWLPLLRADANRLAVNTAPGPGRGSVRNVSGASGWWLDPDPAGPAGVSLAEFSVWWAEAFESDTYRYDPDQDTWLRSPELLPEGRYNSWLM